MNSAPSVPVRVDDPINSAILSVSEDKLQGFQVDPIGEISGIKVAIPNMTLRVIDRAIQVHGAAGVTRFTPLAHMYQHARWARFADGADEIHQMRIAQRTIAAYKDFGTTKAATGDLPI